MARKKKPEKNPPLVVDAEKFTNVIRGLANSKPAPLESLRRKNPETDPRCLPVFDFKDIIRIEKPRKK